MEIRTQEPTRAKEEERARALSHDMRAPLMSVISLTQMSLSALREDGGPEGETVELYLRNILLAAKELDLLTRDMLEETKDAPFTARDLAAALSATFAPRAREKAQLLRIDVSAMGEGTLMGDRAGLHRILVNLLSNAVKYTPAGGTVSLTGRIAENGGVTAEFVVEDNGMGMEAAFLERMYRPLERAQEAARMPGHGLGLAIVQKLTQRMRGTIEASSEPGRGTRFTLRVPLRRAAQAQEAAGRKQALTGKRFLLAEDNDLSAQIAEQLLGKRGASVRRAADGTQAVEIFSGQPMGTFDAILMDLRMPGMGGCRAAQAIRSIRRADAERIPILALTAGGDAQDERQALAAGMNACLRKPLDVEGLSEALWRVAQ